MNTYAVEVKQLKLEANSLKTIVPVDNLPAGVYLVTLSEGDNRISKKVMIAR